MLNINLFRKEKGGNPDLIRESQKRRFASVELVDKVIEYDALWRKKRASVDVINKYINIVKKFIGTKYREMKKTKDKSILGKPEDALPKEISDDILSVFSTKFEDPSNPCNSLNVAQLNKLKDHILKILLPKEKAEVERLEGERNKCLSLIGNIVSEKSVVSKNEDNNGIIRTYGETPRKKYNHVDLLKMLGGMDCEMGSLISGKRGFFLLGDIVRLNYALIQYSLDFLGKKGFTPIYTPFFMKQNFMQKVAQLEQFDEELYKVTEGVENEVPKYLIATSEQPICAYHTKKWFKEEELPLRYAGVSTNFRKEVGSHGKDTLGIFRIHQFDKVEQFCVTSPKNNASWKMFDEMISNAEEFWKSLKIPYRVVSIVSGKLNNAAALKYDLECWFPSSGTFRELVSCSNCTDYQARKLDTRFGKPGGKKKDLEKEYVHMLNSTCCAVQRAICAIVENYQTEEGVEIPEVLQGYMGGKKFMKFVKKLEEDKKGKKKKGKKGKKKKGKDGK